MFESRTLPPLSRPFFADCAILCEVAASAESIPSGNILLHLCKFETNCPERVLCTVLKNVDDEGLTCGVLRCTMMTVTDREQNMETL